MKDTVEKLKLHMDSLQQKHDKCDRMIREGYSKYLNDQSLALMKKEKLQLKDEIEQCRSKLNELTLSS